MQSYAVGDNWCLGGGVNFQKEKERKKERKKERGTIGGGGVAL